MKEEYYSNCLIEALKTKIKWGRQIHIIYISSDDCAVNKFCCPTILAKIKK